MTYFYRLCVFIGFAWIVSEPVFAQSKVSVDDSKKQQADSLFRVGDRLLDTGAYSQAKSIFEQTQAIYKELNLQRNVGNSINRMALVYYYQGNYEETFRLYEKSRMIYQIRIRLLPETSFWPHWRCKSLLNIENSKMKSTTSQLLKCVLVSTAVL